MAQDELVRLLPGAPPALRDMLDGARGAVEPAIRSEIFGLQRFAQHGRSLGETHRAARPGFTGIGRGASAFFPRLRSNIRTLREAHRSIGVQAATGYDVSPAAEWLLDNFHLIEAQLKEIHEGLPRRYFRALPVLIDEPLAGLPRIYGVAWAFVAHTDGAFDEDLLIEFLRAYQETRELNQSELWALPTTLRVVLIENLRRLAERVATNKAAREVANLCCDRIDTCTVPALQELLAALNRRGVGRVFLAQLALRLQAYAEPAASAPGEGRPSAAGEGRTSTSGDGGVSTSGDGRPSAAGDGRIGVHEWLRSELPALAPLQAQQAADQAADNLSVSNAVTSLRAIGDADWPDVIARTSALTQLMLGSPLFEAEHSRTRDQTLHAIERLALRSRRSEVTVARTLLGLMQADARAAPPGTAASHWLNGAGGPALARALGLPAPAGWRDALPWRALGHRLVLPGYLAVLALGTAGLVAWMLLHPTADPAASAGALDSGAAIAWAGALAALLMLFPASEALVAVINRLISESVRPRALSRLALPNGIPAEHRVMVVIPAMLTDPASTAALVHRLLLHHLANPEHQAQFALLTDWADAGRAQLDDDGALLHDARQQIEALNAKYAPARDAPPPATGASRFILLHRPRAYSESEQRWIGWERKRGKLEQLVTLLAEGPSASTSVFLDLGTASRIEAGIVYLVTLDSDTHLPPGRLRELVGVAAHPNNRARLDAAGRNVVGGYAILQPRIVTPLPAPRDVTLFHWLFAGRCGIDPYSAATSEIYQDLFDEGTFTGKGLLDVRAVHAVLCGRLPEGQVLSHDLLEGSIARCAAVTDITLIEDAPFHADVAASRVHRWTRGDWQLLPFLFGALFRREGLRREGLRREGFRLRAVNRWKMFDNLRRSLVAPASLALLLLALAGLSVSPGAALALVLAAFCAGPLLGAVAGFSPSRDDLATRHFYRQAATELARALWSGLWHLGQLLQHALNAIDAITRALYRLTISRRRLLEWTTAATAQARAVTGLAEVLRRHWVAPLTAALLLGALFALGTPAPVLATLLCLLWAATPLQIWWVSRPRPLRERALAAPQQAHLAGIARDTWRFFERCVTPQDHHLPPDNLQTAPHDMLAHRTSPTNIGLYLLSTACARSFGWIGTQELLARMEATLATLAGLQRHRGHFLNWYDTQTCAPLLPMYVSTVDSGNLSGHLLAVAQACLELARAPHDGSAARRALIVSRERLAPWLARVPELLPQHSALARMLAMNELLAEARHAPAAIDQLLHDASEELVLRLPQDAAPPATITPAAATPVPASSRDELAWCLSDHLATLRSALLDVHAEAAQDAAPRAAHPTAQATAAASTTAGAIVGATETVRRLHTLARDCERFAWGPDFGFLYHRKRHLFHIGYRVAEQELDSGFYDLLASEARLTSLLAIAKGDVPVSHWASLGRLFYAVGARAGLRSWSGSMFEYLMPTLVLDEPHGSVLRDACQAAIGEQIRFAQAHQVPWGISESAYAGSDHTLAYQYAPQGVPRLALRRTPPDELVIAPYATLLAAPLAPRRVGLNLAALEALTARARYGFIEALDYSPARQAGTAPFTPVHTFMSHHQGMSIVALANVLLGGVAQRWGMATPQLEAVASLLHERAPREVSTLYAPPAGPPPQALQQRAPGLLREVLPGAAAIEPTHLLSNGRYSVALRANGAGSSRWGALGVTRWRDDALRDAYGSFFHLRWDRQPRLVSITQHPAPDAAAQYRSVFHADRVCFDAAWPEVQAHTTVWVSPEDDIEFRQVELRNLSDRSLDIELLSAFEVTLADARADEAHPAFSNLFVRASWLAAQQALVFERKARLATETGLHAAHFIAQSDPQVVSLQVQTDRQRWLGRNRSASRPLASLDAVPGRPAEAASPGGPDADAGTDLDTGLDPVCVLALRLRIAPQGKAQLTFATAASDHAATLHAVIDKYRQASHVQRASLMSATLAGIRLRALQISAANFAALQTLTTALMMTLTRVPARPVRDAPGQPATANEACDRRLLWRFGISGDRPIVLVAAATAQGMGLLRSLAQGLNVWAWGGVACDLVIVNAEPASYQMTLQRELGALRERHHGGSGATGTALHVLRADELSADELSTLKVLARVRFQADGRPLLRHLEDWSELHEQAFESRHDTSTSVLAVSARGDAAVPAPNGGFVAASGEFRFEAGAELRPLRPWINVLANPAFGAQLSEAGGGYTWALNSRLNQLTAWSNDAVADAPSEWFLLQDVKTLQAWSVTPGAWGDETLVYRVAHGQGYSVVSHRRGDVGVKVSWCVDAQTSVKQVQVRLVNRGRRTQQLRVIGIAEWMMGAQRSDRGTTCTALYRQRLPALHDAAGPRGDLDRDPDPDLDRNLDRSLDRDSARASERDRDRDHERKLTALLCTQNERSAGFGAGTAFLALAGAADEVEDWTCDRRECFDARGRAVLPDTFGRRSGTGLDPCAALATLVELAPGESVERTFLLGFAPHPDAARQLAARAAATPARERLEEVRRAWDERLGATQVKTPDPLFDAMVNRWLLYQTLSCRLWAKAGFYQAGGATGFRDQLQDALALSWAAPEMLREQIVVCASRQFAEGDVQHWWHAPTGAGVRTHFSDDLLWLPHACVHYLRATGDLGLLDQSVPFLEGAPIPDGAEDAYYTPTVSTQHASVYEHAARCIDRSLRVGAHGLPLMGSGDWNDGMNRVGHEGRGESVWLGWFLCRLVADFAPQAQARGDTARAARWLHAAQGWRAALNGPAWDGQWFKRAFFDDGTPLGSHANAEGRIDLIAQAWAVLSAATPPHLQRIALAAVEEHLVDHDAGLIRLLTPPLVHAQPSAGYIQAYPPGVRENGGQYSHAGVWAVMARAQADLALKTNRAHVDGSAGGGAGGGADRAADRAADGDAAYRWFTHLSPAHRAHHPTHGKVYGIEPYVVAGDVYTQPPYVGRGGWSWYTGAAAWMHRAAIESLFGLHQGATQLTFTPCLPSTWPRAELTLTRDRRTMRFILLRTLPRDALETTARSPADAAAQLLLPGQALDWPLLPAQTCFVIPLLDEPSAAQPLLREAAAVLH